MKRLNIIPEMLESSPLTDREKEVIRLVDIEGLTITQVAKRIGTSKANVSATRKRAIRKLQEFMKRRDELKQIVIRESRNECYALAFSLFEEGKSPAQVVIEYKIDPELVKEAHESWLELKSNELASMKKENSRLKKEIEALKEENARLKEECKLLNLYRAFFRSCINAIPELKRDIEQIGEVIREGRSEDSTICMLGIPEDDAVRKLCSKYLIELKGKYEGLSLGEKVVLLMLSALRRSLELL